MYAKYLKRLFDLVASFCALLVLSPVLLVLSVVGAIRMKGNPFFTQLRPGKGERIFRLIKFRSMTLETDVNGQPLPDEERLTNYGKFLRSSSLDELPELINILIGDMSLIGPRPLLVRDMVFMTAEQRRRHTVRPGLTGLAQSNGRNGLSWDNKLAFDLDYISRITFWGDIKILLRTVVSVLKKEGINEDGMATAADLGDYLLHIGRIDKLTYTTCQAQAEEMMKG